MTRNRLGLVRLPLPQFRPAVWIALVALTLVAGFGRTAAAVDNRVTSSLDAVGEAQRIWQCRSTTARPALLLRHGGTKQSEAAVDAGLRWLVAHQLADGSWSFDHRLAAKCGGKCGDPGSLLTAKNAATAMALLPLLGAGQTQRTGEHKAAIGKGLKFLVKQMKVSPRGGDFSEKGGLLYSHGLAAIALCEAYGMSRDKQLLEPASRALQFIDYAQDPVGGGWRYRPRQPGDTSVFGWQMSALHAGALAGLTIRPETLRRAGGFLDGVQANGGAHYGYIGPGNRQTTTAIGLLGRTHLGWEANEPGLVRGVKWLAAQGPSQTNLYYNYYAVQVLRLHGGEKWKGWNATLRDWLVDSQAKDGHEKGSWFVRRGDHGCARAGRLYATSMNLLALEVYYRYPVHDGAGVVEVEKQ